MHFTHKVKFKISFPLLPGIYSELSVTWCLLVLEIELGTHIEIFHFLLLLWRVWNYQNTIVCYRIRSIYFDGKAFLSMRAFIPNNIFIEILFSRFIIYKMTLLEIFCLFFGPSNISANCIRMEEFSVRNVLLKKK